MKHGKVCPKVGGFTLYALHGLWKQPTAFYHERGGEELTL